MLRSRSWWHVICIVLTRRTSRASREDVLASPVLGSSSLAVFCCVWPFPLSQPDLGRPWLFALSMRSAVGGGVRAGVGRSGEEMPADGTMKLGRAGRTYAKKNSQLPPPLLLLLLLLLIVVLVTVLALKPFYVDQSTHNSQRTRLL